MGAARQDAASEFDLVTSVWVSRAGGPVASIGAWTLADVDDEAGAILRPAPDEIQVFGTRRALLIGDWRADADALFVAGILGCLRRGWRGMPGGQCVDARPLRRNRRVPLGGPDPALREGPRPNRRPRRTCNWPFECLMPERPHSRSRRIRFGLCVLTRRHQARWRCDRTFMLSTLKLR
jgi:hypothetical protein